MEVSELCHDSSIATASSTATSTNSLNGNSSSSNDSNSCSTTINTISPTMSSLTNETSATDERKTALPSLRAQFPSASGNDNDDDHTVENHSHRQHLPAPTPSPTQTQNQQTSPSSKPRHQYQIQYQLQHQHIKPFLNLPLPPPLANSTTNTSANHNRNNTSSSESSPTPGYYQQSQSYHHYPHHNQAQQSQQPSIKHPHQRPIAPHPPSAATQTTTASSIHNETHSSHNSNNQSYNNNRKRPLLNEPLNEEVPSLKRIIQQCTTVYQKIGKYRVDPLTEAERNKIIDDVFSTTETMLKLLNDLHSTGAVNTKAKPTTTANGMIDVDNNHTNNSYYTSNNETANDDYELIRQARNLQKNSRSKYRRRSRTNMLGHRCHSCNTTDTPEWRRGPDGARTLCNACGLHYSKLLRKGSLTVQTHNYMIEPPPTPHSPQQQHHPPTVNNNQYSLSRSTVEYPIIQVSGTASNARGIPSTAAGTSQNTIPSTMHCGMPSNPRIVELKEEED